MSISRIELERIAQLASLDLDPATADAMAGQVGRILDYVAALERVSDADVPPFRPASNAEPQALRPDAVAPVARVDLKTISPDLRDGLVIVPRVGALGDADAQ